jgi:flagellin
MAMDGRNAWIASSQQLLLLVHGGISQVSVLRVNTNVLAYNALGRLRISSQATAKSLERLSSGLRINRASDDAAGLSISEKLRGQVRGLTRASANAMDGISLLQTAEGALQEVHSILQRMRELSVQAANGVYTANDRQAIQLEVNQLADEIDRISSTTEFNTKKLLDGTLGALVSTNDYERVKAIVEGDVGKGGNFVLRAAVKDAGQLQVQKTDVFATTLEADAVGHLNYLTTYRASVDITTAGLDGTGNTGVELAEVRNTPGNDVFGNPLSNARLILSTGGGNFLWATSGNFALETFQAHDVTIGVDKLVFWTKDSVNGALGHSIVLGRDPGTNLPMRWTSLASAIGDEFFNSGGANLVAAPANVTFNNVTHKLEMTLAAGAELVSADFVDVDDSGSEFLLNMQDVGGGTWASTSYVRAAGFALQNNGVTDPLTLLTATSGTSVYTLGTIGTTGQIDIKFDINFDWAPYATVGGAQAVDVLHFSKSGGGNSIQDYGRLWQVGAVNEAATFLVSAIDQYAYTVYALDNNAYTSLTSAGYSVNDAISLSRGARISNASGSTTQLLRDTFTGAAGSALENVRLAISGILQQSERATFNISPSNVLAADQLNTLASLNRFQDFGVFEGRSTAELDLYVRGTGQTATLQLSRNDTLEDMAGKISLALWNLGGTGLMQSDGIVATQLPDLVHVNTIGAARGTVSITTPMPGAELVLAGDEALLKALSLIEVRAGIAPVYSVAAFDAHTGQSAGSVMTASNEIIGLLPGVRLLFDNSQGVRLDPRPKLNDGNPALVSYAYLEATDRPRLSVAAGAAGAAFNMFVHIVPTGLTLQIGANQGQTIKTQFADTSAQALGVAGLLVVDSELAQESISIVDHAIAKVSSMRSRLGAVQNRLESSIRNLDVASENLTSSESRIRDVDVAAETVNMTRNQILIQSGIAALAQANQLPQTVLQLLR